jgi:hypothetical protein
VLVVLNGFATRTLLFGGRPIMKRTMCIPVATSFLALILGVVALLGHETACGTLISATQLEATMAGACPDTACGSETCGSGGCNPSNNSCAVQGDPPVSCGGINVNRGEKCNDPTGKDPGWSCSQTTRPNACNQYISGNLNNAGNCQGVSCTGTNTYCGDTNHNCTQTQCAP